MLNERISAIIVDDEKPSRIALSTYIRDFCPDVEIVAECDSADTAHQAIQKLHPQLVFLDIEMPNGNGFDLLNRFVSLPFKVIFITAYAEYAIRAFRFAAVDYLLKPVKVDELKDAVNRVITEISVQQYEESLKILLESLKKDNDEIKQLVIRDIKGFIIVKTSDLIMCEADGYCTKIHLTGKRKITSTKSLGHFENLFDTNQMIKPHRSYLINPAKITGYTRQGVITLEENLSCPLGKNFKKEFLDRFGL